MSPFTLAEFSGAERDRFNSAAAPQDSGARGRFVRPSLPDCYEAFGGAAFFGAAFFFPCMPLGSSAGST